MILNPWHDFGLLNRKHHIKHETVSYIKPRVIYNNDTIEFSMDLNGTIDIDLETYTGDYMMDPVIESESQIILKTFSK